MTRLQKEWLTLFLLFAIPGGSVVLIYKALSYWTSRSVLQVPHKKTVKEYRSGK